MKKLLAPLTMTAAVAAMLASSTFPTAGRTIAPVPVQTPPPAAAATQSPMSPAEELNQALNDIYQEYGFDVAGWEKAAQSEPRYALDKSISLPEERAMMERYFLEYLRFEYFDAARTCVDRAATYPDRPDFMEDCNRLLGKERSEMPGGATVPPIVISLSDGIFYIGGVAHPISGGWDLITSSEIAPARDELHKEEAPVEAIIEQWTQEAYVALAGRAPDVTLELDEMAPRSLVLSERDSPKEIYHFALRADLRESQVREIEQRMDALGYSAWVGSFGGIELTPNLVVPGSVTYVLKVAAHEGEHKWLDGTPLSKLYGLASDATILNESAANLVQGEVGGYAIANYLGSDSEMMKYEREQQEASDAISARFSEILGTAVRMHENGATEGEIEGYLEASKRDMNREFGLAMREITMARLEQFAMYNDNPLRDGLKELRGCVSGLSEFNAIIGKITTGTALERAVEAYCGDKR